MNSNPRKSAQENTHDTVDEIKLLLTKFESEIAKYTAYTDSLDSDPSNDEWRTSKEHWKTIFYRNSLIRTRIFIENNFRADSQGQIFLETLGVLSLTRYAFESLVWAKHIARDSRYALVYYHQLISDQKSYYASVFEHNSNEIALYKQMDQKESALHKKSIRELTRLREGEIDSEMVQERMLSIQRQIDDETAKEFCTFFEDAKINGYGFQSHLIETKAQPQASEGIASCEQELSLLNAALDLEMKELIRIRRRWSWADKAKDVEMEREYRFIYSYTSRLLHATPTSIITDSKNLQMTEIQMFVRYIHYCFRQLLGLSSFFEIERYEANHDLH